MGDVEGVFGRVRRDKRIANLLYGLLGFEDERDPQAAIADLARVARAELGAADPAYRVRVAEAAALLIELVRVMSTGEDPAAVLRGDTVRAELVDGEQVSYADGRMIEVVGGRVVELPAPADGLRLPGDPPTPFEDDVAESVSGFAIEDACDEDD